MLFDFETYINLLKSFGEEKLTEQESTPPPSGGASGGGSTPPAAYPTVTKWESGLTRGKANPVNNKEKWTTGIKRGKSNTLL